MQYFTVNNHSPANTYALCPRNMMRQPVDGQLDDATTHQWTTRRRDITPTQQPEDATSCRSQTRRRNIPTTRGRNNLTARQLDNTTSRRRSHSTTRRQTSVNLPQKVNVRTITKNFRWLMQRLLLDSKLKYILKCFSVYLKPRHHAS